MLNITLTKFRFNLKKNYFIMKINQLSKYKKTTHQDCLLLTNLILKPIKQKNNRKTCSSTKIII
ncbi:hypothetical protein Mgra_00004576 [Meloidogyne graminicola]|uniref:Uncharacterized protein n=1 Tax=Meloidogyne graminicola TaxID=189291 RepID=A0A8S9ZRV1_9BILA|nr:hypothetical protein Mgra_00004576 [Meloidogyne graminicola]